MAELQPTSHGEAEPERSELVFAYGSLRRGAPEEYRMVAAEFVCPALVQGQLYEISSSPALVLASSGSYVAGDLYRLSPALLEEIAAVELPASGEGNGAIRKVLAKVRPHNLGQAEIDAWIWEWTGSTDGAALVRERDWLERCIPRQAPFLTAIAMICLLCPLAGIVFLAFLASRGVPLGSWRDAVGVIVGLGMLSPVAGLGAVFLADRRRERWRPWRPLLYPLLAIASIPAVLFVIALLFGMIKSLVR